MHVSIRELRSLYGNLFRALGMGANSAYEAMQMVVWMDLHGFKGFDFLCARVGRMEAEDHFRMIPTLTWRDDAVLTAYGLGASVLALGPPFVDLAIATHRLNAKTQMLCENIGDGVFAPGIAAILTARYANVMVRCLDEHSRCVFELHARGHDIECRYRMPLQSGDSERGSLQLHFGADGIGLAGDVLDDGWSALPSVVLQKRRAHKWCHGTSVNSSSWDFLSGIANRMLVPESEESRLRGAGMGADVN